MTRLERFLYLLMRDELVLGSVERLVEESELTASSSFQHIKPLAKEFADILASDYAAKVIEAKPETPEQKHERLFRALREILNEYELATGNSTQASVWRSLQTWAADWVGLTSFAADALRFVDTQDDWNGREKG